MNGATLHDRIVLAVEHAGISAEQMAAVSGWGVDRIRCVLGGSVLASPLDVVLIAWATGADVDWLVAGTDLSAEQIRWCIKAMPGVPLLPRWRPA